MLKCEASRARHDEFNISLGNEAISDVCLSEAHTQVLSGIWWMNISTFPSDHILCFLSRHKLHDIIQYYASRFVSISHFCQKIKWKKHALNCHIKSLLNQGQCGLCPVSIKVLLESSSLPFHLSLHSWARFQWEALVWDFRGENHIPGARLHPLIYPIQSHSIQSPPRCMFRALLLGASHIH